MSLNKPDQDPGFATNTNYGAGPYSGQANKAVPPAGVLGEGFNPGAGLPAEWLNERLGNHGSWINYLQKMEEHRERFDWADDATAYTTDQAPVTGYAPATLKVSDVSGSITLVGAGSGATPMMSRALQFTPPSAGNFVFYSTTAKRAGFGAGSGLTIANFYWGLRVATKFSAVPSTTNSFYFAGIHSSRAWAPSGNGNVGMFGLRYLRSESTHWQFQMDGTRVALAAGQDPVNNTWQFWDIEFFGQGTPQGVANGGVAFGRLSLNGSQVATINGSPGSGSGNRYIVLGGNTDTGSAGANFFASTYVNRWSIDV